MFIAHFALTSCLTLLLWLQAILGAVIPSQSLDDSLLGATSYNQITTRAQTFPNPYLGLRILITLNQLDSESSGFLRADGLNQFTAVTAVVIRILMYASHGQPAKVDVALLIPNPWGLKNGLYAFEYPEITRPDGGQPPSEWLIIRRTMNWVETEATQLADTLAVSLDYDLRPSFSYPFIDTDPALAYHPGQFVFILGQDIPGGVYNSVYTGVVMASHNPECQNDNSIVHVAYIHDPYIIGMAAWNFLACSQWDAKTQPLLLTLQNPLLNPIPSLPPLPEGSYTKLRTKILTKPIGTVAWVKEKDIASLGYLPIGTLRSPEHKHKVVSLGFTRYTTEIAVLWDIVGECPIGIPASKYRVFAGSGMQILLAMAYPGCLEETGEHLDSFELKTLWSDMEFLRTMSF